MSDSNKITVLNGWHIAHHATMADFGGYQMPLWYASAKNEHLSVLTAAGIFDTSHMAVVLASGSDAHDLLQWCFTKDLDACVGKNKDPLFAGRCVYGAFLNEQGGVIDDSIVYHLSDGNYMIVVNAAMGHCIAEHLKCVSAGRRVTITDCTYRIGKIDIQGPCAAKILSRVLADPAGVFDHMPYFSFKGHFDPSAKQPAKPVTLIDGIPILLSRTGYTGEFGFEVFVALQHTADLWQRLLNAGRDFGMLPCGLAARDSLRSGAVLPLSHQDVGNWPFIHHPWPFALPYNDDQTGFSKRFLYDQALLNASPSEFTYAYVGQDLRKVAGKDQDVVLDEEEKPIGKVLTCVTDMGIGWHQGRIFSLASPDRPAGFVPRGLCCGFVKVTSRLMPNDVVQIQDKRRTLTVTIVNDIRPDRTARRPLKEML